MGIEGKIRTPQKRDFIAGEFEDLYKSLPSIEYFFENGFTPIDSVIMNRVVQAINEKHPEFDLKLDSFHSRGIPHAVFTVEHKEAAKEALNQIRTEYKVLEGKREQLLEVIQMLSNNPQKLKLVAEEIIIGGDKYKIKVKLVRSAAVLLLTTLISFRPGMIFRMVLISQNSRMSYQH